MKYLYNNLVDSAPLTASSELTGFLATNIQDIRVSRVYRSNSSTSINIVFDFGSAVDFSAIAIAGHNITSSATTFDLEWNNSDSWTTPAGSTTITHSSGVIFHTFTSVNYRYARLVINDATISDGYVELGRVSIGERLDAPQVALDVQIQNLSTTTRSYSRGRQPYVDEGVRYKAGSFQHNYITSSEKSELEAMFEYSDAKPIFIDFDELSLEGPFYANVSPELDFSYVGNGQFYTLNVDFEEAK